jgi:hypothetical protein
MNVGRHERPGMTANTTILAAFEWGTFCSVFTCGTFWSAVGAIATVFATIGIFLALRQLRSAAWLKAQEVFTEKKFTEARGEIFSRLGHNSSHWSEEEKKLAMDVCRKMDELCRLTPFLGRRAIAVWDDPIAKAWTVLEPLVREERERCRWDTKWRAFEKCARKALHRPRPS